MQTSVKVNDRVSDFQTEHKSSNSFWTQVNKEPAEWFKNKIK